MNAKIGGNEATVALVLVNTCAAFSILSAYGPENTRALLIMVATLMGMMALYPIYRLLQKPIRYKIRKETDEDQETYVLRYKGYLWWYDAKDKDGKRMTFKNVDDALNFVRSNVITILINEKKKRIQRKNKVKYETVLDSNSNVSDTNQNEKTDNDNNAETNHQPQNSDSNEGAKNKKNTHTPVDNKESIESLKKQVQLSKNKKSDPDPDDNSHQDDSDEKDEEEEENKTKTNRRKSDIHPAEELTETFNKFFTGDHTKKKASPNHPSASPDHTIDEKENQDNNDEQPDESQPSIRLTNENPIQRFGPDSVNTIISQKSEMEQMKTGKKRRKKTADENVLRQRQMTFFEGMNEDENNTPPETSSSGGPKIVKKLKTNPTPDDKTTHRTNKDQQQPGKKTQEDFQKGSEITKEPHDDNKTKEQLDPNQENPEPTDFWDSDGDNQT